MAYRARNLGGGRVVPGEGDIKLDRADRLLAGQRFDFVKIDVEGMEMDVLSGMSGLLADWKSSCGLSTRLMKNSDVAELASDNLRAAEIVPRRFFKPVVFSSGMALCWGFFPRFML